MIINNSITTLNAYNNYSINQGNTSLSLRKLASGLKINSAAENAALLAISEKMRSQTRGLSQSISNAYGGRDLVQTAEGALGQAHSVLQRMRELAVQAANGTNTAEDRRQIQGEIGQLSSELNRISSDTEFNSMKLLDGSHERRAESDPRKLFDSAVKVSPDSRFKQGEYNMTLSGADASAAAIKINDTGNVVSGVSGSFDGDDVSIVNGADFGAYRLEVADNANGTFTGTMTAPDGTTSAKAITPGSSGAISFGDISIDFSDVTSMSEGTMEINVTGDLRFDVTDKASGAVSSYRVDGYSGGVIDLGGLQLTEGVEAGADSAAGEDFSVNVWGDPLTLHVGANSGQNMSVSMTNVSSAALGLNGIDLTTREGADSAISAIDDAISKISSDRSRMGSVTNRMDHTIRSLSAAESNLTASESRIRDADMAREILDYTRNNILAQASASIMAQSRMMPQSILKLLQ